MTPTMEVTEAETNPWFPIADAGGDGRGKDLEVHVEYGTVDDWSPQL